MALTAEHRSASSRSGVRRRQLRRLHRVARDPHREFRGLRTFSVSPVRTGPLHPGRSARRKRPWRRSAARCARSRAAAASRPNASHGRRPPAPASRVPYASVERAGHRAALAPGRISLSDRQSSPRNSWMMGSPATVMALRTGRGPRSRRSATVSALISIRLASEASADALDFALDQILSRKGRQVGMADGLHGRSTRPFERMDIERAGCGGSRTGRTTRQCSHLATPAQAYGYSLGSSRAWRDL